MAVICKGPITHIRKIWAGDLLIWDAVSGAAAEVQQISIGTNTGGEFTVTFRGYTSAAIPYNAAAGLVQSTLEALTSIGPGNIEVTGPTGGPWLVTFVGALAGQNVPRMDMSGQSLSGLNEMVAGGSVASGLTGGSGEGITTIQEGATSHEVTIFLGSETQEPIAAMEAAEGGPVPAYRGYAGFYVDDYDLTPHNGQIPTFSALVEKLGEPTAIASDNFNRADGDIGISSSGHTWQWFSVEPQIVGNRAFSTGSPNNPAYIECGQADVTAQLTQAWNGTPITGSAFIILRLTDDDNYLAFGDRQAFEAGYKLYKKEGGTRTVVAASAVNSASGDVLKVVASGASIKCYVNGTLVIDTTSTFNQTQTRHGFAAEADAGLDDWSVTGVSDGTMRLSQILDEIAEEVGIGAGERDFSAATDVVSGFPILARTEARSAIEELLRVYFTDLVEVDGKLQSVKRGGAVVATVDAEDLGARLTEGGEPDWGEPLSGNRIQELELPFAVDLAYMSPASGYQQATQRALRYTKSHLQEQWTVNTHLTLGDLEARQIAERLLYAAWMERSTFETALPPKYWYLAPGDPVYLPVGDQLLRCRVLSIDMTLPGPIACRFVLDEPAVLIQEAPAGTVSEEAALEPTVADTSLIAWNGNALFEEDIDRIGLYYVMDSAQAGEWTGASLFLSRDGGATYQEVDTNFDPGTFGIAGTALGAFDETQLWDDANTVEVTLFGGADTPPETRSDAEVLAGENRALVGDEWIAYGTVTPLGSDRYELSHLLRGQRGTDAFADEHTAGQRVVFDDGGIGRVEPALLGIGPVLLKAVGTGQALADVSPVQVYVYGRELMAWSPAQFEGTRDGSDNLTLTFRRRSRLAGSGLVGTPPLDFSSESYEVVIPSPTAVNITGITQAAQAVVTAAGHGLVAGDEVYISGVAGMTPINHQTPTVQSVSGDDVVLLLDSRPYPAWSSGGSLRKVVRVIDAVTTGTTCTASYSAANQTLDFGSPQLAILLAVHQLNDAGERGYPTVAMI